METCGVAATTVSSISAMLDQYEQYLASRQERCQQKEEELRFLKDRFKQLREREEKIVDEDKMLNDNLEALACNVAEAVLLDTEGLPAELHTISDLVSARKLAFSPTTSDLGVSGGSQDDASETGSGGYYSEKENDEPLKNISVFSNFLASAKSEHALPNNPVMGRAGFGFSESQQAGSRAPSRQFSEPPPLPRSSDGYNAGRHADRMSIQRQYPDTQQLFLGQLPPSMTSEELIEFLEQFGGVVDARILKREGALNYSFVVFEDEATVQKILEQRPLTLPNGHRINVEEKKPANGSKTAGSGTAPGGRQVGEGGGLLSRKPAAGLGSVSSVSVPHINRRNEETFGEAPPPPGIGKRFSWERPSKVASAAADFM